MASPEGLTPALDQLGALHALEAKLAQVITARDAVVDEINALIRSAAKTDFNPDAFEADHARLEADYQYHLSAVRTLQSATRPKPGESSLTMPPSTRRNNRYRIQRRMSL